MIDWLVWHVPFLRRRRQAEIKAWAQYAWAMLELQIAELSEEHKQVVRAAYRGQFQGGSK